MQIFLLCRHYGGQIFTTLGRSCCSIVFASWIEGYKHCGIRKVGRALPDSNPCTSVPYVLITKILTDNKDFFALMERMSVELLRGQLQPVHLRRYVLYVSKIEYVWLVVKDSS